MKIEDKWLQVKYYYESCYRDHETKKPIKFALRPSDSQIEFLWQSMQRFKKNVSDLAYENPFLMKRLHDDYEKRIGLKKTEK